MQPEGRLGCRHFDNDGRFLNRNAGNGLVWQTSSVIFWMNTEDVSDITPKLDNTASMAVRNRQRFLMFGEPMVD